MIPSYCHCRVYIGIFLTLSLRALCDSTVSIVSVQPYLEQRSCVQFCLWHPGGDDDLAPFLKCTSPWLNACYCRNDLASSVSSFLTSCVNQGCSSHSEDFDRAVSVYHGYCSSNAPATNIATPTDNGVEPTATVRVVTTVISSSSVVSGAASRALTSTYTTSLPRSGGTLTLYSTETSSKTSSISTGNGSPGSLSQSDKIALGVGLGVGITSIIIGIVTCLKMQKPNADSTKS